MFPIHSSRQTPRGRHRFTSLEQLEDRVTPDAEFQVDTFTDLIQTTPAVASASVR